MTPRCRTPAPPASTTELLHTLRASRLLDDEQFRRLADAWDGGDPAAVHVEELIAAGLLTGFQAQQVMAGRAHRLCLGPYRILDRLGAGGMGQVYKAEHRLMRRLVALKVLGRVRRRRRSETMPAGSTGPPSSGRSPRPRRASEVETAGRLAHPHIVAAYDATRLRGRLVLVLEYVEGTDFERLVNETGPLPVTLVRAVARQAALALDYLHRRGLVHRDVKPANLLLGRTTEGGAPLVKLVDLGLACPAGKGDDQLCGTMDYLAPERGMQQGVLDGRSDLYGLGCTLYHLLTGRVPFPGGNWTAKLLRHRLEVPEPVRAMRPDVPAALADLVERLMAREPAGRPADALEVVAALDRLDAPPPRPTPPRRPLWPLLAVLVAGLATGAAARFAVPPPAVADRPPPAPRRATIVGLPTEFASLQEAVDAAADGATVLLHGEEPWRTAPVRLSGKSLTIRGVGPAPAVLERAAGSVWEPLLHGDRPLRLERLHLRGGADDLAPLVAVERASLALRDCRVEMLAASPALALRQGTALQLDRCQLGAAGQALAVETPADRPCAVAVRDSAVEVSDPTGAVLLLWAAEPRLADVRVELTGSALRGGRIIACRSVAGPVTVRAHGGRIEARQRRVSFAGYADPAAYRDVLRWSD